MVKYAGVIACLFEKPQSSLSDELPVFTGHAIKKEIRNLSIIEGKNFKCYKRLINKQPL